MSNRNIYLDAPDIGDLEKKYLNDAVDSGYVSTVGPYVTEFENRIADYLGSEKAVSTQSGTAALHMALYELGIGGGDEVIVPALTFIATVNPIMYVGARPVFADVDIKTWNILPLDIEKKITPRTKAIIPVHLYGNPCDMDAVMSIAQKHGIYVIEDATESLGATYKNRHTGIFGDMGCLSFNGNKTITTGGGGMVVGKDNGKIEHVKFLVNQSRDEAKGYYHPEIGFNYRMTNIEASLGIAQMEKLENFLSIRRKINLIYKEELKDLADIVFQQVYNGGKSSCWLNCIMFSKEIDIAVVQKKLNAKGVPTRRIFTPVTEFPPYKEAYSGDFTNSYSIYEKGLCLPSSTLNSDEDIFYVCSALKELI